MKKTTYLIAALMTTAMALGTGCGKKGPAENTGKAIDKAGENIKDAVTPDGPMEKVGKKMDKTVDKATD